MCAIIRHTKSTSSPRGLHDHSSSPRACATSVLNDVLSSTRLKPFCSSQVVFTSMDPDIAPDSAGACSGHDPVLAPGSPAARKRKPRRLREEGAEGVAIMISDTRGLWHAHMIRSAAGRPRGKIRHRRPWPRIDQVALGMAGTRHLACTSWSVVEIPLLGNGSRRRVPCCPNDFNANNSENKLFKNKYWAEPQTGEKSSRTRKTQVGVVPLTSVSHRCFSSLPSLVKLLVWQVS